MCACVRARVYGDKFINGAHWLMEYIDVQLKHVAAMSSELRFQMERLQLLLLFCFCEEWRGE